MRSQKSKTSKTSESISKMFTPNDLKFRYSLELVATIAAHLVDESTIDFTVATERAIKLLDAVSTTIEKKAILLRDHENAKRLSQETPEHLEFAKGIRRITVQRTEIEATKEFRKYLRLNIRLGTIKSSHRLTDEQVKALFEPLPNAKATAVENALIEKLIVDFRRTGFSQREMNRIKIQRNLYQTRLVGPYQNSEKGKKGGRPVSAKNK